MTELVATVPEVRRTRTRAVSVAAAAALVAATIVVAIALWWPSGRTTGTTSPATFDIPQRLITQAAEERAAWENVDALIEQQKQEQQTSKQGESVPSCALGQSC